MKSRTLHQERSSTAQRGEITGNVTRHWPADSLHAARFRAAGRPSDQLRGISRRGLWSLQLFLLISCAAFLVRDFNLYTAFPEGVLQVLGCPPPPAMALCALAGYIFTVLTPLTIHLLNGDQPTAQWRHLGYRSAFYMFFLWSGTLAANFVFVFATGITLYLLEQLSVCVAVARTTDGNSQPA